MTTNMTRYSNATNDITVQNNLLTESDVRLENKAPPTTNTLDSCWTMPRSQNSERLK